MYPSELYQYINERNGVLNKEEIMFITDIELHSQIDHVSYNTWDNTYDMWDCEGNHYHFSVRI